MSSNFGPRRGRRKSGPTANKQQLCPMWPESGGCLSTTLPEKVALRPFMRESWLLLCGKFSNLADSKKNSCYGRVEKMSKARSKNFSSLPPGGGWSVAGNGNSNCRRRGIIVDAKEGRLGLLHLAATKCPLHQSHNQWAAQRASPSPLQDDWSLQELFLSNLLIKLSKFIATMLHLYAKVYISVFRLTITGH